MNKYLLFILGILILPVISAAGGLPIYKIDAYYEIFQNNSVHTNLNLTLSRSMNSTMYYGFDHNATGVLISDGINYLNYTVIDEDTGYSLNISLVKPTNILLLRYYSDSFIFMNENANLFTTTFLSNDPVLRLNMFLSLPEGAKISNSEFMPNTAKIVTDGEKINLIWKDDHVTDLNTYSVKYELNQFENKTLYAENKNLKKITIFSFSSVVFMALIIFAILFYYKGRLKKVFLLGFFDDEQKVITYLKKYKSVWQTRITKEFNFSRAKTTRIVAKLIKKGLITKEEFGRNNKIHWI